MQEGIPRNRGYRFRDINEFNILEDLGAGGFSKVLLVQHKKTKRKYALKCAMRYKKEKDRSKRTYMEIKVLQSLNHPNIIQLKGWFEDTETIYLVLEYVKGKDCHKFFKHMSPTSDQVKSIMKQLIDSLRYCHDKGIVHRDIKLENILIDKKNHVKLIDFGLCGIKETEYDMMKENLGTVRYTAPELIKGEGYNDSVDIWGLGVVFFMLLTGEIPFNGSSKESIFRRITEKNLHYTKFNLERKEVELLKALLEKDPSKRVEIEEILDFPYFQN